MEFAVFNNTSLPDSFGADGFVAVPPLLPTDFDINFLSAFDAMFVTVFCLLPLVLGNRELYYYTRRNGYYKDTQANSTESYLPLVLEDSQCLPRGEITAIISLI